VIDAPVAAIADAVGTPVSSVARLRGGDFAAAFRVTLADQSVVFAKTHGSPPPGFFTREAADLAWLDSAGAVLVPTVLAVSDGPVALLVLSWVPEGGRPDEAAFGRSLAGLHRAGATAFGRVDGRTTGSLELPNTACATWVEFFGGCRLEPLLRVAHDRRALPPTTLETVALVAGRLGSLGVPEEPPARLHGDLWAGNRLADDRGRSWLVDPAAHGGHREFDLAMMRLFGGFGPQCFAAYHDAFPLAEGWERLVALHQLAPLLVHAIKFGGGYVDGVARAARQVLALV
jgi:fructosamine-3-kinase